MKRFKTQTIDTALNIDSKLTQDSLHFHPLKNTVYLTLFTQHKTRKDRIINISIPKECQKNVIIEYF